jgi:hypothetical protein
MSTNVAPVAQRAGGWTGLRAGAWAATALFALLMMLSGIAYLVGPSPIVDGLRTLGYPPYFRTMLGVAKIAGAVTLLVPRPSMLREWAYAGFVFDLSAAIVSHIAVGDSEHSPPAFFALALVVSSYVLRRRAAAQR